MSDAPSGDFVPRSGSRWIRITLLALIPVLVLVGGGIYLLNNRPGADTRQADAQAAVDAYLGAWSKLDYAGMAAQADAPAATISAVDAPMRAALEVKTASYTPTAVTRDESGDRATVPFTAKLGLADVGPWSYAGSLTVVKTATKDAAGHRQWKVQFSPASIQPRLAAGRTLERVRITGKRGQLLDDVGVPLRGADQDIDVNLLGTVGPLTAEQAKATRGDYRSGDIVGQTGIEKVYNAQLGGRPGADVVLMQGSVKLATLAQFAPVEGKDVTTTIDLRIQRAGEQALTATGLPAALVAIDTRTGGVSGLVNQPYYGVARAVRNAYPPGSTFKIITATAGLLNGRTEQSTLNCPQQLLISDVIIKNANKEVLGPVSLKTAFAQSCNTAFVNLKLSLTEQDMNEAAQLYGFNSGAPLPITSVGGTFPKPSGPVYAATEAFGQADVTASPLQMASVAAAVASSKWRQPFVVGQTKVTHPIPAAVSSQMQDMMRAVVTSGTAASVSFPGEVRGKTGTAQYGVGPDFPEHSWFVGYRGTVAFAVFVEGGGAGASVAAPIASRFLTLLGPA